MELRVFLDLYTGDTSFSMLSTVTIVTNEEIGFKNKQKFL